MNTKRFLFGAVVGSGLIARAADNAGADYLLALNAGRFRIQGASSLSCFLPIRSANEWVMEFSERELLGRCKAPLFAGLTVCDPTLNIEALVEKTKSMGFDGVCNFPTTSSLDGSLARLFEREGLGFTRELELVRLARRHGLDVFANVYDNSQARQMVDVGANNICVNIGFTGGGTGVSTPLTLEDAARQIEKVLEGIPGSIARLCHGGPITSPEQALALMRLCRVEGFVAGSTLDRLPVEQAVDEVTQSFTAIPRLAHKTASNATACNSVIGSSAAIVNIREHLQQLSTDEFPVLIAGETGTGKSLLATRLHNMSPAAARTPVIVDCPALDATHGGIHLLGQGYGNDSGTPGALERSAGSTLILENINSLDKPHQGKLLSFLDNGMVTRIGEHEPRVVQTRIVATTNIDPDQLSLRDDFRIDLYYRLAGHVITIPPLRDRLDDVPDLAFYFARNLTGQRTLIFSNAALDILVDYDWPGNVRELKHVIARALQSVKGDMITRRAVEFLRGTQDAPCSTASANQPANATLPERDRLLQALVRNAYHRSKTAEELGITTRTLYTKIRKLGIEV